jgi:chaperone LolA
MRSRSLITVAMAASVLLTAAIGNGLAVQVPAGRPSSDDPEAIVRRADRALAMLKTLRAEFVQRVENPILEKTTTGRGTLLYRAPDRFRISYRDPAGDLVVNDGTHVWIYLPSSQPDQVIRQRAAESGVQNPLTYLRDLHGGHIVRHAGVETVSGRDADHLVLSPSGERGNFERLDVWVDRTGGLVRQLRTEGVDGVVTTYTFQGLEPNVTLDASRFRFSAPRGVEVFDQ